MLHNFEVCHTSEMGWANLSNGKLLSAAEGEGFTVFVTVDKNLRFQQTMLHRKMALVTLAPLFTNLSSLQPLVPQLLALLEQGIEAGAVHVLTSGS